jgi:hypothetical protein
MAIIHGRGGKDAIKQKRGGSQNPPESKSGKLLSFPLVVLLSPDRARVQSTALVERKSCILYASSVDFCNMLDQGAIFIDHPSLIRSRSAKRLARIVDLSTATQKKSFDIRYFHAGTVHVHRSTKMSKTPTPLSCTAISLF